MTNIMNFVREFVVEANALAFARSVNGIVQARYDWDNYANRLVRIWVVKY